MNAATIRFANPGAQYPGISARKFGSTKTAIIGGGHKIAVFDSSVKGAAALFDLLARLYVNLTLAAAIKKWSGGNNVDSYLAQIKRLSGYGPDTKLTLDFLHNQDKAIALAKAMAHHETGVEYPMSEREWIEAHALAFPPAKVRVNSGTALEIAYSEKGTREVKGSGANPTILRWYVDAGHPEIKSDEVPNCAAAMSSWLKRAGMAHLETLAAIDYCKYGEAVDKDDETQWRVGDIGILWRGKTPADWESHVGFVVSWTDTHVTFLGANQGDEVNETKYARSKLRAIRRPVSGLKPVGETLSESKSLKAMALGFLSLVALGITNAADVVVSTVVNYSNHILAIFEWGLGRGTEVALTAAGKVEPIRDIAVRNDLPFPVWILLFTVGSQLALSFYREFVRKQVRSPVEEI